MSKEKQFEELLERYNKAFYSCNEYTPFYIKYEKGWVYIKSKKEHSESKLRITQFEKMTKTLESRFDSKNKADIIPSNLLSFSDIIKKSLKIAHDNTHSTSRIFRNIELIKKEDVDCSIIENRLTAIENAARECITQVDVLYKIIKELENKL